MTKKCLQSFEEVKQRKDSAEQYRTGEREELALQEDEEQLILEAYLPQMMGREDIEKVVQARIEALGITDKSSMGKLMGAVMSELKDKADGNDVKEVVETLLNTD